MTFRARETVWDSGKLRSNTLLPMIFTKYSDATGHIKLLQKPYNAKGFNQSQEEWWARQVEKTSIHRWTIEEDD
jgi:hypothetical protein